MQSAIYLKILGANLFFGNSGKNIIYSVDNVLLGKVGLIHMKVRCVSEEEIKVGTNHPPSRVNIAKVGSKNRVCLPPNLVDFLGINEGDNTIWILKEDEKGRRFSYMNVVKPENFEVESEEVVSVIDTFK